MNKKEKGRNTDGLKAYATTRNNETIKKVNAAIEKMKRSKSRPVNFNTVAKEAGVAKATLYNNKNIRERIQSLRALNGVEVGVDIDKKEIVQIKESDKLHMLREQIRTLKRDKKKLILQLEVLEELKEENNRLKKQLGIQKKL